MLQYILNVSEIAQFKCACSELLYFLEEFQNNKNCDIMSVVAASDLLEEIKSKM